METTQELPSRSSSKMKRLTVFSLHFKLNSLSLFWFSYVTWLGKDGTENCGWLNTGKWCLCLNPLLQSGCDHTSMGHMYMLNNFHNHGEVRHQIQLKNNGDLRIPLLCNYIFSTLVRYRAINTWNDLYKVTYVRSSQLRLSLT